MLINTVIVFLRDLLPIFIVITLLLASRSANTRPILFCCFTGLIIISITALFFHRIANLFSGAGIEVFYSSCHIVTYGAICRYLLAFNNNNTKETASFGLILLMVLPIFLANGTNFIIYFTSYPDLSQQNLAHYLGTILGIGICLSFSVLFFVLLKIVHTSAPIVTWLLLLSFGAGQIIQASNLLLQVDLFINSNVMWNSTFLLDEHSEFGHFFIALFGYEATPELYQILFYGIALFVPAILKIRNQLRSTTKVSLSYET